MSRLYISCALLILCHSHWCLSANILAVFHFPSYSHFRIGEALCKGLAAKGHNVTVISNFPQKTTVDNYHDVFIENMPAMNDMRKDTEYNLTDFSNWSYFKKIKFTNRLGYLSTKYTLESENVKNLMKSKTKFDVVLLEHFHSDSLQGFCKFYEAHCVLISTVSSSIWTNRLTGNVALASTIPSIFTKYAPKMTFFQRIDNLICLILQEFYFHYNQLPEQNELLQKYFPNSTKHINDLIYDFSIILINSHPTFNENVPITSNIKQIGGVHLHDDQQNLKDLPENIKNFLDNNEEVIYFALGSILRSSKDLSKEKIAEIIETFKLWNKPILWKYEELIPDKPENVMIAEWLPQTAVLAHKNVKAFITHCGRMSTIESLYFGVPMIALPIFAEQLYNAAQMTHFGYAITLDYQSLNRSSFYKALIEITTNPRYTEEVKRRSQIFQEFKPLDEGIYWIEHVIKFNGASYLKNEAMNMVWYKFWMIDALFTVFLTLLICTLGFSYLFSKIIKKNNSIKVKTS